MPKTEQLQIRVTPQQKAALRRLADQSGMDVSAYVLEKLLTVRSGLFAGLILELRDEMDQSLVLAELHDLLEECPPPEFAMMVGGADLHRLTPRTQNYVAAMVEVAAGRKGVMPPDWTSGIVPLDRPYFTTTLRNLRLYLLQVSPVPFKRRNIFVDSTIGARV